MAPQPIDEGTTAVAADQAGDDDIKTMLKEVLSGQRELAARVTALEDTSKESALRQAPDDEEDEDDEAARQEEPPEDEDEVTRQEEPADDDDDEAIRQKVDAVEKTIVEEEEQDRAEGEDLSEEDQKKKDKYIESEAGRMIDEGEEPEEAVRKAFRAWRKKKMSQAQRSTSRVFETRLRKLERRSERSEWEHKIDSMRHRGCNPSPAQTQAIIKAVLNESPQNRQKVFDALTFGLASAPMGPEEEVPDALKTPAEHEDDRNFQRYLRELPENQRSTARHWAKKWAEEGKPIGLSKVEYVRGTLSQPNVHHVHRA